MRKFDSEVLRRGGEDTFIIEPPETVGATAADQSDDDRGSWGPVIAIGAVAGGFALAAEISHKPALMVGAEISVIGMVGGTICALYLNRRRD